MNERQIYFKNKKILIYGLGKSGIACFNFLKKKNNCFIFDDNKKKILDKFKKKLINFGKFWKINFYKLFDLLLLIYRSVFVFLQTFSYHHH